jgi:hypothetical protein
MAYSNAGAIIRNDINSYVLQAASVEKTLVAQQVLPPLSVGARAATYPRIRVSRGELLKAAVDTLRAQDGSYGEITRSYESDTYDCLDRGLEERIDDAFTRDMDRFFDNERITAQMLLRNIMLAAEVRCAAQIYNTSVFATTNSGTAYSEANLATFDFAADFSAAQERLAMFGQVANTLVLNLKMWNRIRRSAKFQAFLFGNLPSGLSRTVKPQDVGDEFGVNVIIAAGTRDTAKKGQTATLSFIWPDSHVWIGNVQSGDFAAGGAGRTLVWSEDSDLYTTETYREEGRRGDMVRVRQNCVEKIIDETAGQLIATQV